MAARIPYNLSEMAICLCSCSGSLCCCLWVGPGERVHLFIVSAAPSPPRGISKRITIFPWTLDIILSLTSFLHGTSPFLGYCGGTPSSHCLGATDTVTPCSPILLFPYPHAMLYASLPSSLSATVAPASLLPPFGRIYLRKCRYKAQLYSCTSPRLLEASRLSQAPPSML